MTAFDFIKPLSIGLNTDPEFGLFDLDWIAVQSLPQRLVAEGAAKVEGQKRRTRYVDVKGSSR